jgi:hypothetical protein
MMSSVGEAGDVELVGAVPWRAKAVGVSDVTSAVSRQILIPSRMSFFIGVLLEAPLAAESITSNVYKCPEKGGLRDPGHERS